MDGIRSGIYGVIALQVFSVDAENETPSTDCLWMLRFWMQSCWMQSCWMLETLFPDISSRLLNKNDKKWVVDRFFLNAVLFGVIVF